MNPIPIGHTRELFWDDYLVNTSLTGTRLQQHSPRREELAFLFDRPWEGDGCDYFSTIYIDGKYRMYFMGNWMINPEGSAHMQYSTVKVCCIESEDGIHWTRPELDIHSFGEYEKTNILIDLTDVPKMDNFHCFIDENPNCPPDERIKATFFCGDEEGYLWCWTSVDGYHFKPGWRMTNRGRFDTQNVAFWSAEFNQYFCFIRDFHDIPNGDLNAGIRDIRYITSPDFKTWSDPVMVDFGGKEDIPLYTSAAFRYPRAPQMMVGMPSRYVERHQWTGNFDQLAGAEARKQRIALHPATVSPSPTACS